MNQSFYSTI